MKKHGLLVTRRLFCPLLVLFGVAFGAQDAQAQCTSLASGNWNDGTKWSCAHQPTSADGAITVVNGHTMTVTAAVTVDQVTVNAGGQVVVNSGVTWTVANGGGDDLTVNGTVTVTGTITGPNAVTINSGGAVTVTGAMNLTTGNPTLTVSGTLTVDGTVAGPNNVAVPSGGILTVSSTGTLNPTAGNPTVTVNGTMAVDGTLTGPNAITVNNGGIVNVTGAMNLTDGNPTLTVNSGGTVNYIGGSTTISSVSGVVVTGTITMSGASSISVVRGNGGNLVVANSGGQISMADTSQIIGAVGSNVAATVVNMSSGSTLIVGPSALIGGPGQFNLASGASMRIGSTAGITTSGATGNVQVSSTRTFSTGANYTYNGTAAQATGNGLPATVNNLTIANTGGNVTLTAGASVSAVLTLTSGDLVTGANTLTQSGTSAGNTDVVGNTRRTDVGGTTRAFGNPNVQITNSGGTLTTLTVNLLKASPVDFGNSVRRTYTLTGAGTTPSAVVRLHYLDAELNGNSEATLELWKKGATWVSQGATTRDSTNDWVEATGVTGFSPWTIAGPTGPTAVEMVGYSAGARDGKVLLQWETGREVNNLGFNVYREQGGKRVRINKSLIVGSGLMASPGTVMTAGRIYAWRTAVDQADNAEFWVEEIDFNGRTTWHGPIISHASNAKMSAGEQAIADQTVTLSDLAAESAYNGVTRPVETFATLAKPGAIKTTGLINPQPPVDSPKPGVKISLKQEGWYRIGQPQLVGAGLDPSVNPNRLQLFANGVEIPMSVTSNNGVFDSASAIEFYGLPVNTPSTDTHVYNLIVGGNGKRVQSVAGQGGLLPASSFLYAVERRDRSIYLAGVRNGEAENFFGTPVGSAAVDQAVTLKNVDASAAGQATIEIGMQGLTAVPHGVTVSLNGNPIGTIQFSEQSQGVSWFQVSNSSLLEGQNLVTLEGQPGGEDVSLVDHIGVSYWRTYAADGNALKFTATANQEVTLSGFTTGTVKVFDVTNPLSPTRAAATVTPQTASAFAVIVAVPGTGARTLLAIGDDQTRSPLFVTLDKPSSWKSKSNAADLVIITHGSLIDSYRQLQTLRQSQGLKVALVDVEDIYDEFNFGSKSPQAIKDFLSYARTNWKTAPRFVLLAGSASYDPKNYNGLGEYDLVPTKLIDTNFSETSCDDWVGDFDLDGIPELSVGRLPTRTSEEANTAAAKLAIYDGSPAVDSALLVADDNLNFDFEAASNSLAGLFPGTIAVQQINRGQIGTAEAKQQLLAGIASGQKFVNYVGHGSPSTWRDSLLTAGDALGLTNSGRYPMFIAMTCLNGEFQQPQLNPLATALMNSREGGAIAVWASSGFTIPIEQSVLNQQFYTLLFQSSRATKGKAAQASLTLGEITRNAKSAVSDPDIRRTWILFGDPSMRLK